MPASYKINVTYFKPSGKFYAEGFYYTQRINTFKIFEDFRDMLKHGRRPGLCDGHSGLSAVLDCTGHPYGYPKLFKDQA